MNSPEGKSTMDRANEAHKQCADQLATIDATYKGASIDSAILFVAFVLCALGLVLIWGPGL